ncbi:hypothetical protein NW841_01165 [Synechococcus sp. H60.3]
MPHIPHTSTSATPAVQSTLSAKPTPASGSLQWLLPPLREQTSAGILASS